MTLHNSIDEMMQEYAERASELGRDFNVVLDYSEESLQGLEKILAQLSDEHRAALVQQNPALAPPHNVVQQNPAPQNPGPENPARAQNTAGLEAGVRGEVEEQMVMMAKLWGGYLGEVVRRRWGGEWAMETYPGGNFATLTLNVRGAKLFPSMKIYRRLTEGSGEDVWAFFQKIRQKLTANP